MTMMDTARDRGPLGPVVRRLRGSMTQAELGAAIGKSEALIAHIETGKRSASMDTLAAIRSALRLSDSDWHELVAARAAYGSPNTEKRLSALEERFDRIEEAIRRLLGD